MSTKTETSELVSRTYEVCKKPFASKDERRVTCSRSCGAKLGHTRTGPRQLPAVTEAGRKLYRKRAVEQHRQWRKKYPKLENVIWLREQYWSLERTLDEIAEEIGVSRTAVTGAFRRLKISLRTERSATTLAKTSGENNWAWKGGIYNGRPMGFSGSGYQRLKIRKKLISERGEKCEWCRCGPKGTRIEVHHPIPFRFCRHHRDAVLLCKKHHAQADQLFLGMAGEYFASNGCSGFEEAVMTLKSTIQSTTTL